MWLLHLYCFRFKSELGGEKTNRATLQQKPVFVNQQRCIKIEILCLISSLDSAHDITNREQNNSPQVLCQSHFVKLFYYCIVHF